MIDLIAHNLAPIMFISVMTMLLIGYPVAITLAAGAMLFFWIGVELSQYAPAGDITLTWNLFKGNPDRIYGVMNNETLLAIPFFTFMGIVLERSGMAEDLLDTIAQLFGPVRGGLAYAVIIVGALLAATTGVVAASVMAMGLISLPIMMRYGYDRSVATGTIAASGTMAQIVPPSLVLIVMADQLGKSVGDMYVGALWPAGIILVLYCLYIFVVSLVRPNAVPALPKSARVLGDGVWSLIITLAATVALHFALYHTVFSGLVYEVRFVSSATAAVAFALGLSLVNRRFNLGVLSKLAEKVIIVLIPPLALIFLVLGTIFLGIATPTEGGAMGATGALVLAVVKGRLDTKMLNSALIATTKLASFVMFILIGARVFGLTFYGVNGNEWIKELLLGLPGGQTGFLIVVTIIVFILGCFLDFFEIAFIMVPLLVPVASALGIDLIWFGIILGLNLQTSFLTPPFGFSLFYLRSVAPINKWKDAVTGKMMDPVSTIDIYKGVLPFIIIQVFVIGLVIAYPGLVTHYKGESKGINPQDVVIELPTPGGGVLEMPSFGTGNDGGLPGLSGLPPGLGGAPDSGGGSDLSQPPSFN